jgi:hypothetical protein
VTGEDARLPSFRDVLDVDRLRKDVRDGIGDDALRLRERRGEKQSGE